MPHGRVGATPTIIAAAVIVLCAGCGTSAGSRTADHLTKSAATGSTVAANVARGEPKYRLIRAPIVIVYTGSDQPYFQVRIRVNRRLPVGNQGVAANLLVGTSGSDDSPVPFGKRSRHCYASVVGNDVRPDPALSDARDGSTARLTIRIRDERQIVQTVTLRSAHHAKISGLACGKL